MAVEGNYSTNIVSLNTRETFHTVSRFSWRLLWSESRQELVHVITWRNIRWIDKHLWTVSRIAVWYVVSVI